MAHRGGVSRGGVYRSIDHGRAYVGRVISWVHARRRRTEETQVVACSDRPGRSVIHNGGAGGGLVYTRGWHGNGVDK